MSSAINILNFGNLRPSDSGRTQIGRAICAGSSFVNRLDFETNMYRGFEHPYLHGLRVYCSDSVAPISIHYLITPLDPFMSKLVQVEGTLSPNGIRDAFVYAEQYVNMFGYLGSAAGEPTGPLWRQTRSEVAGCLLKGVELYYVEWVDGMRLHFDCGAPLIPLPAPPAPTVTQPPVPSTVTVTVNATVILPPQTPVTTTVIIGTGASASTIVTVLMLTPAPVTGTLLQGIATAPGSTATVFTVIDRTLAAAPTPDAWAPSSLLWGMLAGSSIVVFGIVFALLILFARLQLARPKPREPAPQEMADLSAPPDVDPPAYLVVPISHDEVVQDVPLELAEHAPRRDKGKAEEDISDQGRVVGQGKGNPGCSQLHAGASSQGRTEHV